MSKKNKNKNIVDEKKAFQIFDAYGVMVTVMNTYQYRLNMEENESIFFDWYHTTGSLVRTDRDTGHMLSLGKKIDIEDIAILISNDHRKSTDSLVPQHRK